MKEGLLMIFSTVLASLLTYLAARKKNASEAVINELDAVERAVKVWRELSESIQVRYDSLYKKVSDMETELNGLRTENQRLIRENEQLLKQLKKTNNG